MVCCFSFPTFSGYEAWMSVGNIACRDVDLHYPRCFQQGNGAFCLAACCYDFRDRVRVREWGRKFKKETKHNLTKHIVHEHLCLESHQIYFH